MRRKAITIPLAVGTASILMLVGCSSEAGQQDGGDAGGEPITVQLGHTLTEESSWQVGAEHFAERIDELTDGRYKVEIFPNGQLASGNQGQAIELLRQGSYDVDITSSLIWSSFDEELGIVALPWILPNLDRVEEVLQGDGGDLLLDILGENGVTPVAIGETGYRQMLNNEHQIEGPEDLEALKMRVPGTPLFLSLFAELGADPVQIDFTEVFTALQQGTVDGMEGVPDVMVSSRLYEVLDYMSLNNYNFDIFFFTFSNSFYDGLSEEDKELFMQAGKEATEVSTDYARTANEEAIDFLSDELEVYEPSDDEIAAFQKAAAPIYDEYRDTFSPELREAFAYPE